MDAGLTFIDTAEVYGFGKSEEFLGEFMKEQQGGPAPIIASKFAPQPWRFTADTVPAACKASLKRLQLEKMALYMIHWWGPGLCQHQEGTFCAVLCCAVLGCAALCFGALCTCCAVLRSGGHCGCSQQWAGTPPSRAVLCFAG
jgi:diketogulonate reductase-like aldo/keto reductase